MPARWFIMLLTATLALACAGQAANATRWVKSDHQDASSTRSPPDPDAAISVFRSSEGTTIYFSDDNWEEWRGFQFDHVIAPSECPAWGYICDEVFLAAIDVAAFERREPWIGRDGMLMQPICIEPLNVQLPCSEGIVFWKYYDDGFGSFTFKVGYGVNRFMLGGISEPGSDGMQHSSFTYFALTNGLPLLSPERRSTPRVDPEAHSYEIWND